MTTKLEILNPYICDAEMCDNFSTALNCGMTEVTAISVCQEAMRRIIGNDPELTAQAIRVGITCGLYLADQNGEF